MKIADVKKVGVITIAMPGDPDTMTPEIRRAYGAFMAGFRVAITLAKGHPEAVAELFELIETENDMLGLKAGNSAVELMQAREWVHACGDAIIRGDVL